MFSDFISLIFPDYCFACSNTLVKGEQTICTSCRIQLPYASIPVNQSGQETEIMFRFKGRVNVKHALVFLQFVQQGRTQKLLHHLKYKGSTEVGIILGKWFGEQLLENGYSDEFDLIVPVPLHKAKLRKRGYNQSDFFAEGLAIALGTDWNGKCIRRLENTESQTKKNRLERWQNVANRFEVVMPELIQDKHVLLVDDVLTTGATLEACANELLKAGCAEVSIATIAAA